MRTRRSTCRARATRSSWPTRSGAGVLHHASSVAVAGLHRGLYREDMFDEGQKLPSAVSPHEVRVRAHRPDRCAGALARVPPGRRRRALADRRDGQDRRALLLLQGDPAAASLAPGVGAADRPRARLHEHRAGRLRRGVARPHRAPARSRRPGVSPDQPALAALGRGPQRVRPGRARPAARTAARQAPHRRVAEGRPLDDPAPAGAERRPPRVPRGLRHPAGDPRPRRARARVRHARHRAGARRLGDRGAAALRLRGEAVGLLGAQPRPGSVPRSLSRGGDQRPDRAHHGRVVGHRPRRRGEGRRRGRDPAARRAQRGQAARGAAGDRARRRHRLHLPGRPVEHRRGRGDDRACARRPPRRRHARQQRGSLDPPLGRAQLRALPRLRAHDGAELLRHDQAHHRAAAAHARARLRAHRQRLLDRRPDEPAAVLGLRRLEGRPRRVHARRLRARPSATA